MAPKLIVFTLVHGTFARGAPWTQKGSSLRATLAEAFEPARVEFRTPEWSGKNRHLMRKRAALTLREEFKCVRAKYPDAKHFVIAHSHGGNAVRLALTDQDAADRVDGVITLNTPFVETVRRDKDAVLLLVTVIMMFCILATVVNAVWAVTSPLYTIATVVLAVASISLFAALQAHLESIRRTADRIRSRDFATERAQNVFAPEAFLKEWRPPVKRVRFLCLASAGDEAISGLSFLEGLANIPHILFHPTLVLYTFALFILLGGIALVLTWTIGWPPGRWLGMVIVFVPWGLFLLLAVAVAAAIVLRSLSLGISVGFKAVADDLLVHRWIVSYVPMSVAQAEFQDYEVQRGELDDGTFLLHSSIYDSEFALKAIQLWIKGSPQWGDSWATKSTIIVQPPKW